MKLHLTIIYTISILLLWGSLGLVRCNDKLQIDNTLLKSQVIDLNNSVEELKELTNQIGQLVLKVNNEVTLNSKKNLF